MRVVARRENIQIVEFIRDGVLQRVILPADAELSEEELEYGIPYGIAWEELHIPQVNAVEVANAFRRVGIWTLDDLRRRPNAAIGALMEIFHLKLSHIREQAEQIGGLK
jgi:hypothetical protein